MKIFLAEFLAAICAAFFLNAYFNDKPADAPPQKVVIQVEQQTPAPVKPSNVNSFNSNKFTNVFNFKFKCKFYFNVDDDKINCCNSDS